MANAALPQTNVESHEGTFSRGQLSFQGSGWWFPVRLGEAKLTGVAVDEIGFKV